MQGLTTEELDKRINDSYELPNNVLAAMPKPMVTVSTSTYQHAPYIRQCIEGVLMQKTDFAVEYIIGEDFSTDGTREIVFEYAKRYPDKIRVITADYNVGMKANGLRRAKARRGKYLASCEGDDYWTDPNKLQMQVDVMEANPEYSLCFHYANVLYTDRDVKTIEFPRYDKDLYTVEDVIEKPWFIPTQSILVRKSMRESPTWLRYIFNGDWAMQLLLANKGPFCCIAREMSVYRRHKGSLSANMPLHQSTFNKIEIMKYFDMHTNFKYHEICIRREKELISNLYKLFLYQRPFLAKLLSIDYYRYKLETMCRFISEQYRAKGLAGIPHIAKGIITRKRH